MNKRIIALGMLALMASCSPKTTEAVTDVNKDVEDVAMSAGVSSGKVLFEAKCHKCHDQKTIDKYSSAQWDKILPSMAKKAKLTTSDTDLIQQYIAWELQN